MRSFFTGAARFCVLAGVYHAGARDWTAVLADVIVVSAVVLAWAFHKRYAIVRRSVSPVARQVKGAGS